MVISNRNIQWEKYWYLYQTQEILLYITPLIDIYFPTNWNQIDIKYVSPIRTLLWIYRTKANSKYSLEEYSKYSDYILYLFFFLIYTSSPWNTTWNEAYFW